jgi:septal ring factor EnvC (AmiA/AmiB activator)
MSELFTEPMTAEETNGETRPQSDLEESGALAVSVDDFSALEERVKSAVELVKQTRRARADAEARAIRAEGQLQEQLPRVAQLEGELNSLRAERDQVRERVERLLKQLDALEL